MEALSNLLNEISDWFSAYVPTFYSDDKNVQDAILMKEEHTAKVREISRELALHLGLSERDVVMAELIGLLHDVGRFRQYQQYHTFVDYLSEDHAALGIKVISEQPFLEKLRPEDRYLIFYAIQYHNKKTIAFSPDKRVLLFAKIIRDADKLDIYRVLEPFLTPPDGSGVSPLFQQHFVDAKQADYFSVKTNEDKKIVRLMWAYDINFSWTLQKIVEHGYYDKIYKNLPHTLEIAQGMNKLCAYVMKKCAEKDTVDLSEISREAETYIVENK